MNVLISISGLSWCLHLCRSLPAMAPLIIKEHECYSVICNLQITDSLERYAASKRPKIAQHALVHICNETNDDLMFRIPYVLNIFSISLSIYLLVRHAMNSSKFIN